VGESEPQLLPEQNTVQISDEDWFMPEDQEVRIFSKTWRNWNDYPYDQEY
jgi:hypothetical protein